MASEVEAAPWLLLRGGQNGAFSSGRPGLWSYFNMIPRDEEGHLNPASQPGELPGWDRLLVFLLLLMGGGA